MSNEVLKGQVGGISADQLRSYIERIEKLEEEKHEISEFIKDIFLEAKSSGYDPKIMRLILKQRKMDQDDIQEQEVMLDVYRRALGMELPDIEEAA
ncbi:MAG: DUF2312 domain-containing protein [Alphaproteobacteria bacterium]|nr:DUF2312 domain-containing protein [Alphaproteobacteria bacterium]